MWLFCLPVNQSYNVFISRFVPQGFCLTFRAQPLRFSPKISRLRLLGSHVEPQAATTEEEEEEESSEDSAGPCLHSEILHLSATIHTHRPAISIGLEICSCQRTPERNYRKQQLAAKGTPCFCCCSRVLSELNGIFFHFSFYIFRF